MECSCRYVTSHAVQRTVREEASDRMCDSVPRIGKRERTGGKRGSAQAAAQILTFTFSDHSSSIQPDSRQLVTKCPILMTNGKLRHPLIHQPVRLWLCPVTEPISSVLTAATGQPQQRWRSPESLFPVSPHDTCFIVTHDRDHVSFPDPAGEMAPILATSRSPVCRQTIQRHPAWTRTE
jgi:hypothetical protein